MVPWSVGREVAETCGSWAPRAASRKAALHPRHVSPRHTLDSECLIHSELEPYTLKGGLSPTMQSLIQKAPEPHQWRQGLMCPWLRASLRKDPSHRRNGLHFKRQPPEDMEGLSLKCIFYYSAFSRNVTFLRQAVIMRSLCQTGASEERDLISAFFSDLRFSFKGLHALRHLRHSQHKKVSLQEKPALKCGTGVLLHRSGEPSKLEPTVPCPGIQVPFAQCIVFWWAPWSKTYSQRNSVLSQGPHPQALPHDRPRSSQHNCRRRLPTSQMLPHTGIWVLE